MSGGVISGSARGTFGQKTRKKRFDVPVADRSQKGEAEVDSRGLICLRGFEIWFEIDGFVMAMWLVISVLSILKMLFYGLRSYAFANSWKGLHFWYWVAFEFCLCFQKHLFCSGISRNFKWVKFLEFMACLNYPPLSCHVWLISTGQKMHNWMFCAFSGEVILASPTEFL